MKNQWQLQEAKSRLSELVDKALTQGPQTITRRGKDAVVVMSSEDYRKLRHSRQTLVDFFRSSPLAGVEIPPRSKELYKARPGME